MRHVWVKQRTLFPRKKMKLMNGTPYWRILMLLTWLKPKQPTSGSRHNINSIVKSTAEITVICTLYGHRSHIRSSVAAATGW
jgi:hypothetical protein